MLETERLFMYNTNVKRLSKSVLFDKYWSKDGRIKMIEGKTLMLFCSANGELERSNNLKMTAACGKLDYRKLEEMANE